LGPELATIDWKFRERREQIHKHATFYLMFSRCGDPVPERAEGITAAEWVRLDSAHQRISYPNATAVVLAVQRHVLDVPAEKSHTGRSRA
jgi:hypothetical protein